MKALRVLKTVTAFSSSKPTKSLPNSELLRRFYSAQPQQDNPTAAAEDDATGDSVFDSAQYTLPNMGLDSGAEEVTRQPTWEQKYRAKANLAIFGEETQVESTRILEKEDEKKRRAAALAKALLEAALRQPDEEEEEDLVVNEEDQKSLTVGIIGAPNAGKSALTNYMTSISSICIKYPNLVSDGMSFLDFPTDKVGTKVAAVSRKTNTTTHEVLGIMTKGNTQICFFDTPGLMLSNGGYHYNDVKVRVESGWASVNLYDVLIVIFDVHRHLNRPDGRVVRLINRLGAQVKSNQRRVLCMNKVDLVEKKKDLLKVAEEFKDLPGYERYFMISGLKGSGVKDLTQYLMEQAVKRPWDEDPFTMSEEVMKTISLEVVRERLLEYVHQEIPYNIEHCLVDWKELRDGSLRIEQHFITHKMSQRKILVGKNGSKIGRIGTEANEELRSIFKRNVHLILLVRVK